MLAGSVPSVTEEDVVDVEEVRQVALLDLEQAAHAHQCLELAAL